NSDYGIESWSDNMFGSPHGFIIHWIVISKNIKKVTEVIDVKNWRDKWNIQVKGCSMYKVVKNIKALKFHMKAISWSYGNLREKVIEWKEKLQTVSNEDVEIMVRSMSDEEVKDALFDICDNKAPGPDGYTAKFHKKAWSIVGNDVCNAVKEFFRLGRMFSEINATLITLVPKSSTPQKVSDYRPISCCNVLYKIVSKILTNKIKHALCELANPSQSAFIPGR
nr:RNA-directed DNA polymerase, eukaryota, reverse transcriptase zinc-binding domain protein [Tanacetum cinerariifolium]